MIEIEPVFVQHTKTIPSVQQQVQQQVQQEVQQEVKQEEQAVYNRKVRSANPDRQPPRRKKQNVYQLLQFVKANNAESCLERVICELSASPDLHGQDGVRFGRNLV